MMGPCVVLGAGGMLGRRVCAELARRGEPFVGLTHAEQDVLDFAGLRARLLHERPRAVFNCAAFTRVDECETRRDYALAVNGAAVGVLAECAGRLDALLVHVSSDYVFDGTANRPYREDDPTGPDERLSAYGLSKLDGDRRLLASGCRCLLVRTSWVYGEGGPNFVDTIAASARAGRELKVVSDQRGRPTWAADLCRGIFALLDRGATGIVNVANAGECTWYDFACEIVRLLGLATPVRPCTTADFPRPARRPAYSVLDLSRFERLTGQPLPPWKDAVAAYLREASAAT